MNSQVVLMRDSFLLLTRKIITRFQSWPSTSSASYNVVSSPWSHCPVVVIVPHVSVSFVQSLVFWSRWVWYLARPSRGILWLSLQPRQMWLSTACFSLQRASRSTCTVLLSKTCLPSYCAIPTPWSINIWSTNLTDSISDSFSTTTSMWWSGITGSMAYPREV